MPSVEVIPTLWPIPFRMWAIIRTVVVFPFEPVTEMMGIRDGVPGGNSMSTTGLATYCGSPSVGGVCMRKPGAALTSTMAPPVSRTGLEMSGVRKSMPATSRPMTRAASSAISLFSSLAAHHQHAVVVAGHVALEHDRGTVGLHQRPPVTGSDGAFIPEVEHDPPTVVTVDGLGYHEEPDPAGGRGGLVLGAHDLRAGNRE